MKLKFTILGCGSSMGVPRPDGYFGKCNPKNFKNYRTRCSAILQTKTDNILIDTINTLDTFNLKSFENSLGIKGKFSSVYYNIFFKRYDLKYSYFFHSATIQL